MIVGLMIIRPSSEHYSTWIFANLCSCFWHISLFRCTKILNRCAFHTKKLAEYTESWTRAIGGGICKISFLPERQLSQWFVHHWRRSWPNYRVTNMPDRCTSEVVVFEKISATQLERAAGLLLGWSPVLEKVTKIQTSHGIPQLEQHCPHLGIITDVALAWNGIVLTDSRDNITLFWPPWSGIVQNKSCLLKSYMAPALCVTFLKMPEWGIRLFDRMLKQEIGMFTRSLLTKLILMFWTLLLFILSATSSGNTLSALSIAFGSPMNCISCSWVWLKTYCTGCSNTWKLQLLTIILRLNSHQYHDIQATSATPHHSVRWTVGSGRQKKSGAWSEHWDWIVLQFLTAPRMSGKLRQKQPLMTWWLEQCGHYMNSLY